MTDIVRYTDFAILKSDRGNVIVLKRNGVSLVMFYSKECPACKNIWPVFMDLPINISRGINYYTCDLKDGDNRNLIMAGKANNCLNKLEKVPTIFLFINGKPFKEYDIENNNNHKEGLYNFVKEATRFISGGEVRNLSAPSCMLNGRNGSRISGKIECDDKGQCSIKPCSGGECPKEILEKYKGSGPLPYNIVCNKKRCYLTTEDFSTCKKNGLQANAPDDKFGNYILIDKDVVEKMKTKKTLMPSGF